MTHSYRKNPITGIANGSEKDDKRRNNRSLRTRVKVALKQDKEVLPEMREVSDQWTMNKDGKMRFDVAKYPKLNRK